MTTTKIWYTPPGLTTSNTFPYTGSNVADVTTTEFFSPANTTGDPPESFEDRSVYRHQNGQYYFNIGVVSHSLASFAPLQANISARNWNPGITTVSSYTFPGGGTIPAEQGNVEITGSWLVSPYPWNNPNQDPGSADVTYFTDVITHLGSASYQSSAYPIPNLAESYNDGSAFRIGPASYYISTSSYVESTPDVAADYVDPGYAAVDYFASTIDGDYFADGYITGVTSTLQDVLFYSRANIQVRTQSGSIDPPTIVFGDFSANLRMFFDYTITTRYEVNLHSASTSISSAATMAPTLAGLLKTATTTATADTQAQATAENTIDAQAQAEATADFAAVGGRLQSGAASVEILSTATFSAGRVQPAAATAVAQSELSASGNRTPGGTVAESIDSATAGTAQNLIGISDGLGYIDNGYADPDYFAAGAGLTIASESAILADANIIRSDGTIVFDAAFDATIRPGFRIDGGVITAGSADFAIAPVVTGGVGLLFAAAADLQAQAQIAQAQFGLLIDAAAEPIEQDCAVTIGLVGLAIESGYQFAPVTTNLAVDAESRPSIKVSIEIGDAGRLTATAFVDNSSTAQLAIGPAQLGPAQGGYLLSADVEIVQEINSTFGETDTRIFYVDMYYTAVIAAETRTRPALTEARLFMADPETRVNTNWKETRQIQVDPETRQADPALLPTQLRTSKLFRIPA